MKTTISAAALMLSGLAAVAQSDGRPGVDVTIEGYAAMSGGEKQGSAVHSLALLHSGWEQPEHADTATRWSGYVSALVLTGRGPTERYVGDFLALSNIEGYPSVRLYSWWLEARRGDWSLRAGALLADEEFSGTDGGGNFCNSAFGWPAYISANTVNTGPAFFVAGLGVRLARTWGERASWRLGVYDGDTFDSPTGDPHPSRYGLHYHLGGDQGWFVITETSFAPGGAAPRFTIGAWLHTADFADLRDDDAGQPFAVSGNDPRMHASNHGFYAIAQQTLAGATGQPGAIEVFVRGGVSPADRNTVSWAVDTGLAWTGPLPARPADVLALGLAHAHLGGSLAQTARLTDPGAPAPDYEQVVEASYTFALSEHINLQPDLQYIRHPGGSGAMADACAVLLRFNASF